MYILLVEDEERTLLEISNLLTRECRADVVVARSRNSALELINSDRNYDLIVCDLKIPTNDLGADPHVDHGFYVHDRARQHLRGIPCVFLSGHVSIENIRTRLASSRTIDLLGDGQELSLVNVYRKREQPEFLDWAKSLATTLRELDDLTIEDSKGLRVEHHIARTLRIYARRIGGSHVSATLLSGLSRARVFRLHIGDRHGLVLGSVVAKVDLVTRVEKEAAVYSRYVAPSLDIGAFAPLAGSVLGGCGQYGAVFYSLARDSNIDLFGLLDTDLAKGVDIISRLQRLLGRWQRPMKQDMIVSVGDLRVARISQELVACFLDEQQMKRQREVEKVEINLSRAVQHGDLHGGNVLVDNAGGLVLIDYSDVGVGSAVLDPITLELSLVFHQAHPPLYGWPSVNQAQNWFDLGLYTVNSPVREAVLVCRRWARQVGKPLEIAAVVYAHALRQLKYPDTDKEIALAMAEAATKYILMNS